MAMSEEKAALRTRYRRERNARYIEHSFEFLATTKELEGATVIASYRSYGVEPDTKALNQKLISNGKTLLLPRMAGDAIDWIHWNGDESVFTEKQNIEEPIGNSFDNLDAIEVIIVPALRIDRSGYRLGQGGGYYDRALAKTNAFTIGLIHPDEISSEDLPREPWDIPLSAAATPDLVMRFSKN
jgi:5-formyltetrahydrofolate cyclo-ligase